MNTEQEWDVLFPKTAVPLAPSGNPGAGAGSAETAQSPISALLTSREEEHQFL